MKASIYEDLATALGPALFARAAGIDPDEWQQKLLFSTEKRIILNCCRRSGKSTIVALVSLYHALNFAQALVLVLSPSLRQSSELFKKIIFFSKALGHPLPVEVQTGLALELANGSRIVSLPSKEQTVRGFSGVSLIVIDEAARVSDDLDCAVRPMLAVSGGRMILLSTPSGKRGFFYEACQNEHERFKVEINADQCPRITPEFLAEERTKYPSWFFQQEDDCEFRDTTTSLLSREVIERAFANDLPADNFDFMHEAEDSL